MPRDGTPIETLLLRLFMPALVVVTLLLAVIVYNSLYATIIDRFDRKLATTSALTGALADPIDHDRLIAAAGGGDAATIEASEAYRRNVEPMRRIRSALGLTYLYTQTLQPGRGVTYILDSAPGEDHSPIGSTDTLPDETMAGLQRTQTDGSIHVSPIEFQEKWGLLKTASAPVYGADGRITASAGADVNISIIHVATQNALFASAVIGIGSILACIVVVLAIVRRVARPIEALRQEALRIAAGDHSPPAAIAGPREVQRLAARLGDLARHMAAAVETRRAQARHQEHRANAEILTEAAGASSPVVPLVDSPSQAIWWIAGRDTTIATRLARRAMAQLAQRIAADPVLADHWQTLADLTHGTCVRRDRATGSIDLVGPDRLDLANDAAGLSLARDGQVFALEAVAAP